MTQARLPLLVEPAELEPVLGTPNLLLVDLNQADGYAQTHLPGAVRLEYADITRAKLPAMGLLPDAKQLSTVLSRIGLTPEMHVVAYDAESGSRAARLLWTLDAIGHLHYSLLNGGLQAWRHEGRPLTQDAVVPTASHYTATLRDSAIADKDWILKHLKQSGVAIVDARSPGEYNGSVLRSARGGHIPGAVNFDYVNAIDAVRQLRLRPAQDLRRELTEKGITPEKEIVVYCQTHHRSAHSWFVLKSLGYPKVRGYPGSWSEWGNSAETPIE